MLWLEKEIIIDTISINIAVLIFSILSLIFSIITILIYLRVKTLRTIIYKIFFLIAINETISRIAHILQFINEYLRIQNQILFEINITSIYFTDTNILIFLAYSCYSMVELILKQNKNINNQFLKVTVIIIILSIIMTIIFTLISIKVEHDKDIDLDRDIDLSRNILALNFILDTDEKGKDVTPIVITSIIYFFLSFYSFYEIIRIRCFIKNRGNINDRDEDENQKEEKMQKSLKLKSFQNKMLQYPLLSLYFIIPLLLYSYYEYFNYKISQEDENKKEKEEKELIYLKARFILYNIYCFMNSTRGWMFFRVFISNEKIKIYLFKNFLTSNIFYSIDKIILKRERRFTQSSIGSLQSSNSSLFSNDDKIINNEKNEEEKLLELNENNDVVDENDETTKIKSINNI